MAKPEKTGEDVATGNGYVTRAELDDILGRLKSGDSVSPAEVSAIMLRLAKKIAEQDARLVNLEVMIGMRDESFGRLKFVGPFSPGAFVRVEQVALDALTGVETAAPQKPSEA